MWGLIDQGPLHSSTFGSWSGSFGRPSSKFASLELEEGID